MSNKNKSSWCNSPDHIWRPSRREFLYVGVVGSLGLSLGNLLRLEAAPAAKLAAAGKGPAAKSIINIYLPGGMSAQESFDPKVFRPSNIAGRWGR